MVNYIMLAFDTAVVVCLFLLRFWVSRVDKDLYFMLDNYAKKISSVEESIKWMQDEDIDNIYKELEQANHRIETLTRNIEELKASVDSVETGSESTNTELLKGLANILNFYGGIN